MLETSHISESVDARREIPVFPDRKHPSHRLFSVMFVHLSVSIISQKLEKTFYSDLEESQGHRPTEQGISFWCGCGYNMYRIILLKVFVNIVRLYFLLFFHELLTAIKQNASYYYLSSCVLSC